MLKFESYYKIKAAVIYFHGFSEFGAANTKLHIIFKDLKSYALDDVDYSIHNSAKLEKIHKLKR